MTANRAFVMGHPIGHSRSPMMQGYWMDQQGIKGSYTPLDISPQEIEAFFARYRQEGWIGGNVTVPHKLAVIPHLDEIDADASAIGAVNTIWWKNDKLWGGNTDAYGFTANLDEYAPGWDKANSQAIILGAGGAARAAAYGLLKRGLDVAICNRTIGKAQELAEKLGKGANAYGLDALAPLMKDASLLVNTTSLGMTGQPPLEIDLSPLANDAVVYDIIYAPLETDLLKNARSRGLRTVDGLGMLIHQGALAFSRWFGKMPQVTPELRQMLVDDIEAKNHRR